MEEAKQVRQVITRPRRQKYSKVDSSRTIDVKCLQSQAMQGTAFPRLKKRGPIEARRTASAMNRYSRFPRLKKRGPIEAAEA